MNVHSRAKTTPESRELLIRRVQAEGWSRRQAAEAFGLSVRTAAKWLRRFCQEGAVGLQDRSRRKYGAGWEHVYVCKAERFIQTMLRERAYRRPYSSSAKRRNALPRWLHYYNFHRLHSSLGHKPPASRVNNLFSLDN